jgi:AcrR family transcriptional regulator
MSKAHDPVSSRKAASQAAGETRAALIQAALRLFGQKGFEGTSTREIATAAGANIGSIAYHFGGKEGLHTATADHIVETIQVVAAQAIGQANAPAIDSTDEQAARGQLFTLLEHMMGFFVMRPEAGDIARFVLREMSQPSTALDRIYEGVFEPLHKRLCLAWERVTGQPAESETTKLLVFTMIGQVVYFRIAREVVVQRMGWNDMGDQEAAKLLGIVRDNLDAILTSRKDGKP